MLTLSDAFGEGLGESSGSPHLAKNSEIWGTPFRGGARLPGEIAKTLPLLFCHVDEAQDKQCRQGEEHPVFARRAPAQQAQHRK